MQYDFKKAPAILIQGAMEAETSYLISRLEEPQRVMLGSWEFYTGFLGRQRVPVIISRTYMGIVNAAAATTLALTYFAPKAVINQGIAGGHDKEFHVGDIVLAEKIVPMGAMVRPYSPEGAGISERDFAPWEVEVFDQRAGKTRRVADFPCDERLLAIAESVKFEEEEKTEAGRGLAAQEGEAGQAGFLEQECRRRKIARGILGSADEWNNQIDRIVLLREKYGTTAEEMESAATAQVCQSYGVPFIGIRILSNTIVNHEDYDESVAIDCQKFVEQYVEKLRKYLEK